LERIMASSVVGPGNTLAGGGGRGWSIAVGILLIILGMAAILLPFIAGIAVNFAFGWLLLFAAGAHFAYAWWARGAGAVIWQVLLGILYVFVAVYLLLHPAGGLLTLTLVLAVYFIIEGILEIVMYFRLRRFGPAIWFLIDGIVTLLLGALIYMQWPFSSVWAIGTIIGISLLFSGITRLSHPPVRVIPVVGT
jgi:uncharacterized membrane protein HdeD (DUF308 family)